MGAPFAREVGSVGVRALPLTDKFRSQLVRQLRAIRPKVEYDVTVIVDKVKLNRTKVRASIQSQLARMRDLSVDVDANINRVQDKLATLGNRYGSMNLDLDIDRMSFARLRDRITDAVRRIEPTLEPTVDDERARRQLESLFDDVERMHKNLRVSVLNDEARASIRDEVQKVVVEIENMAHVREQIHRVDEALDDMAEDRTVRVDVNPFTAWASARLKWLTRPRLVEIIPRVSKAALAEAMTALAALSGARLTWDYIDRFANWMSELDKKLPRLTFGITGLTSAFSALMASVSGVVGIGAGLADMLPSLLLLPGLLAGAVMSGVALFVALKDAKDELAELGDSYTNLGEIIKSTFWEEARQPIIDFSNSIMPQLQRSFEKTSAAIGRFTAELSKSFQNEFADGRLEAMFDGLAKSWDIMSTGTDAFARAITNLGLVAARYMPRLAEWFVRQANTFDNWLADVATDGRLDQWMEDAIASFYALWDVMAATTGIFEGLWKAAEAAGSGGLRGFADMLLSWEEAVNGLRWQRTLTAMFRGAGDAMSAFGDGLYKVGEMLDANRVEIEHFMATAGEALGRFIGKIADALDQPAVREGMTQLIDGLAAGLRGLEPALEPLGEAFGTLLGFIGDLAAEIGPVLGEALRILAPEFTRVLQAIEPLLPVLGDAFITLIERLAPHLDSLVDAFVDAAPALGDLAEQLILAAPELLALATGAALAFKAAKPLFDLLTDEKKLGSLQKIVGGVAGIAPKFIKIAGPIGVAIGLFIDMFNQSEGLRDGLGKVVDGFKDLYDGISEVFGKFSLGGEFEGIGQAFSSVTDLFVSPLGMLGEVIGGVAGAIGELTSAFGLLLSGDTEGALEGLREAGEEILGIFTGIGDIFADKFGGMTTDVLALFGIDTETTLADLDVFKSDFLLGWETLKAEFLAFFEDPQSWLEGPGGDIAQGLLNGLDEKAADIQLWFEELPLKIGEWLGGEWESFGTAGSGMIDSLVLGLEEAAPRIGEWLGELPGRILSWMIDTGAVLLEEGIKLILGYEAGMETGWAAVSTWLADTPARIKAFFTSSPTWISGDGTSLIDGWRNGMNTGWAAVAKWLAGLPQRVLDFFGGVGSWLVASGESLLRGFATGVENSIADVSASVSRAVSRIRGLFPNSPAKWGPFSGRGWVSFSGESVGKTFGTSISKSLENARSGVAAGLRGLRTEFDRFNRDLAGPDLATTVQADMLTGRTQVRRSLESLTAGAAAAAGTRAATPGAPSVEVNATFEQREQRDQFREFQDYLERALRGA